MTEWKRIKFATCPKCQRNCSVIGSETVDGDDWVPLGDVKPNSNKEGQYIVECPGCGVFFIVDINGAFPCWEELR